MKSFILKSFKLPFAVLALSMVLAVSCQNKGSSYGSGNPVGEGPAPVYIGDVDLPGTDLSAASGYVILSKSGISNTGSSAIVGNLGVSPAAATAITGFALNLAAGNNYATSSLVDGKVYGANYPAPTPSNLTTAIGSMETAYTDAAGRVNPDATELASGNLGGLTIAPGLYKWGTAVGMTSNVYLSGSSTDTWIFQVAQGLTIDAGVSIILLGGAQPKNIFWQVAGNVDLASTSHFEGIILAATAVRFVTGATMNGRVFSQTAVTLQSNDINQPQ